MDNAGRVLASLGIGTAGLILLSLVERVGFELVKFQPSQTEILGVIAIALMANVFASKK